MSAEELESPPTEPAAPPTNGDAYRGFVVRYGIMRTLGEFTTKASQELWRGAAVIVRTPRGIEWGEVLSPASDRTRNYLGLTDEPGRIMRLATVDDGLQRDALADREREEFRVCRDLI